MSENALDLLSELKNSVGAKKVALSKSFEQILQNDARHIRGAFFHILNRIIVSRTEPSFSQIAETEFYTVRVAPYQDSGVTRVAVGLSYLQDFEQDSPGLDDRIALLIVQGLKEQNLDLIFNDVCVNLTQYRNGAEVK